METFPQYGCSYGRTGAARVAKGGSLDGASSGHDAGKLDGRKLKLTPSQEKHLVQLYRTGEHTTSEIAELFGVAPSTVHRAIQRAG